MFNIQKQISRLYLSSVLGNLSLTGAWVAILSARGYSLVEIGFALFIGHQAAYGTDILMGIVQIWILSSLYEGGERRYNKNKQRTMISSKLMACFIESLSFLKTQRKAMFLMFCNSLVGAIDILLLFFLQAKLPEVGMPRWALGFALFFMEMGGILGAKIILKCTKMRYRSIFVIAALLVLCGVFVEHSGMYIVMMLGGIYY